MKMTNVLFCQNVRKKKKSSYNSKLVRKGVKFGNILYGNMLMR